MLRTLQNLKDFKNATLVWRDRANRLFPHEKSFCLKKKITKKNSLSLWGNHLQATRDTA